VACPEIVDARTTARHSVSAPAPCHNRRVAVRFPASYRRPLRLTAAAAVLVYAVVTIVAPKSGTPGTTYASVSATARTADLAAGLGLLAAGLYAWFEPRTRRLGGLAILAGLAWFGPDWEGWDRGIALARSIGAVMPPLFLALVFHLIVSFPSGRLRSMSSRTAVIAVYTLAGILSLCRALFRDPFLDPYCWRNCIDNSFLVRSEPEIARAAGAVWLCASLAVGVVLVVFCAWQLLAASGPGRRVLWAGLVPGGMIGVAVAAYAGALWHDPLENPESGEFSSIFLILSCSVFALAIGIGSSLLRVRRVRTSLARLVTDLGDAPQPGTLRDVLAAALHDSTLEVVYWLPDSRRYVDGAGRHAGLPASAEGRAVTSITRGGEPVAAVVHDPVLLDGPDLQREIGSTARLAVDNERLQADVRAQLEALGESRARIVETADAERRRLERDLHDGAQQQLLALSYQLRLARTGADAGGDSRLAAVLASAGDEAQIALDELRQLAHGIFPAVLTEAGLGPALATLADTAPIPVELVGAELRRYPAPVETAAYVIVAEAIGGAAARGATFVAVEVRVEDDSLVVVTEDDGNPRGAPIVHVADRVGALGGSVEAGPTTLRVAIPCA
jgi:signal transduction histidine kinase